LNWLLILAKNSLNAQPRCIKFILKSKSAKIEASVILYFINWKLDLALLVHLKVPF